MKKLINIIFIAVFFAICAAPLAGLVLGHKNVNAEKREMAKAPVLVSNGEFNVEFTRQFDDYFTDNFAFRPDLVTLYATLNSALFEESISEQVITGKQGWLFFVPTLNDYQKKDVLSDNEIYRIVRTLEIQRDALAAQGVGFVFAVAPNKSSIYGQYMPERYAILGEVSNAEKLYAAFEKRGFKAVDLFKMLRGSAVQVYHKLDTHWNNTGALMAYEALMASVQEQREAFVFPRYLSLPYKEEAVWSGDLSAMLYPTAGLRDIQQNYSIEKQYKTARPMLSLEDMTIDAYCETGSLDALMFRDSFANALIPVMSNAFATITYSRAVPYDYSLMDEETDIVILEIVERNIPNLLKSAPLLTAPQITLAPRSEPGEMDCIVRTEDMGERIRISGIVTPPNYQAGKNYDIFVRLAGQTADAVFVPFPILDASLFDHEQTISNQAFTMLVDKQDLPEDEYAIELIIYDGEKYFSGFVKEST